jgi:hypothetical protein
MPIKFDLEKYKNDIYVETGFYMGESILKANQYNFKELHSIEINELFFNRGLE